MSYQQPPRYNGGYNNSYNNGYNNGGPRYNNSWENNDVFATSPVTGKSRGVAAILALLLGTLGVHYFYCGKTTAGIVFLACTLCTCGILGAITAVLSVISGILIFCDTNAGFDQKYVLSNTTFPI